VLFPTPHSSIQDLLGKQMQKVFAEKIGRQRSSRAHDPLIMKVLSNLADRQAQGEYERLSTPLSTPAPGQLAAAASAPDPIFEPHVAGTPPELAGGQLGRTARRRPSRPRTVIREGIRLRTAIAVGVVLAAGGAAGLHYAETWLRPGLLVVTSDPPGADVTLDGMRAGVVTPAVLEDVVLTTHHEVRLEAPGARPVAVAVEPLPGKLVRRVHARLETALGAITVESDPAGAEVRLDDSAVGKTPLTVKAVRLDERHRIDLALPGYDIDQFVVFPEKDGTRFYRKLGRAEPAKRGKAGGS
jgi:eukaryotic-like serine/threonine-protein kinase